MVATTRDKVWNDMRLWYKDHLTALGYNLIEYEWFFLDGMPVSVEICILYLDHW